MYLIYLVDVSANRKMLDMILKRKGLVCEHAADGSEAVDLVAKKGLDYFDLIFMDNFMPVICGPKASTLLREMGYSKLIVGVTGNAMDSDVREYEEAGADMILTKPIRTDKLYKLLEFIQLYGAISHFNYRPCSTIATNQASLLSEVSFYQFHFSLNQHLFIYLILL